MTEREKGTYAACDVFLSNGMGVAVLGERSAVVAKINATLAEVSIAGLEFEAAGGFTAVDDFRTSYPVTIYPGHVAFVAAERKLVYLGPESVPAKREGVEL